MVAVLGGGTSSEHEVSVRSAASVAAGLRDAGHETVEVTIGRDGRWTAGGEDVSFMPAGGLLGCDVAFPVLHGPGRGRQRPGHARGPRRLRRVGCGVIGDLHGQAGLQRLLAQRDSQVEFVGAGDDSWRETAGRFGRPLWVKPARLGSSVGIARRPRMTRLDRAVEEARRHDPKVIVEAPAPGKEVECSLLGNDDPVASPPGEIVTKSSDWYDYESKYGEGEWARRSGPDLRGGDGAGPRVRPPGLRPLWLQWPRPL